jgi:hypothetical protein
MEMLWREADTFGPSINPSDIVLHRPAQSFISLVCLLTKSLCLTGLQAGVQGSGISWTGRPQNQGLANEFGHAPDAAEPNKSDLPDL